MPTYSASSLQPHTLHYRYKLCWPPLTAPSLGQFYSQGLPPANTFLSLQTHLRCPHTQLDLKPTLFFFTQQQQMHFLSSAPLGSATIFSSFLHQQQTCFHYRTPLSHVFLCLLSHTKSRFHTNDRSLSPTWPKALLSLLPQIASFQICRLCIFIYLISYSAILTCQLESNLSAF